jgi:hypothetical protein
MGSGATVVVRLHTIVDVFCRTNVKAVVSTAKDIDVMHWLFAR